MRTCADCSKYEPSKGECRANPPGVIGVGQSKLAGGSPLVLGGWPMVDEKSWCAAYELAIPRPDSEPTRKPSLVLN